MKQMAVVVCFDETKISETAAFDALKTASLNVDQYLAEFHPGTVLDMEDAIFVDDLYDDSWNEDEQEDLGNPT